MLGLNDQAQFYDGIADHYDLMIPARTPFLDHYLSLLRPGQTSLLDIACGTGAVTVELARRLRELAGQAPVRVVGIDISSRMLEVARRRDADICWRQGDMRDLPSDCGPVDLAVCCYNSLQHLDATGLGRAFRSIRAVITSGGRFAFDLYRPNRPYLRQPRTNSLSRAFQDAKGTQLEIREDSLFDDEAELLLLTWRLVRADAPGGPPLAQTSFRMWQHQPETVETALAAAGFEPLARYGDLDQSPWHPAAKKHVVVSQAC